MWHNGEKMLNLFWSKHVDHRGLSSSGAPREIFRQFTGILDAKCQSESIWNYIYISDLTIDHEICI